MTPSMLFSGKISLSGLSNAKELPGECPQEFLKKNPWSDYIRQLLARGAIFDNWEWESSDPEKQNHWHSYPSALINTTDLSCEERVAVGGWMLSEMLSRVPKWLPPGGARFYFGVRKYELIIEHGKSKGILTYWYRRLRYGYCL